MATFDSLVSDFVIRYKQFLLTQHYASHAVETGEELEQLLATVTKLEHEIETITDDIITHSAAWKKQTRDYIDSKTLPSVQNVPLYTKNKTELLKVVQGDRSIPFRASLFPNALDKNLAYFVDLDRLTQFTKQPPILERLAFILN